MNRWKFLLVLPVLAAALTACCCPLGTIFGETKFTTGDFADVPAYPGSTQTTESNPAASAMTTVFSFIAEEAEWKQYKTSDSETDVLNWYENTLPDYGWVAASGEDLGDVEMEGGLIFVNQNDPEVMLVVFVAPDLEGGGEISILIGRIRISVDEE
jgi:hypothetical protein